MTSLEGRHALVTGANRGIGAAIARALSLQGARVTLMVRDATKAQQVADSLGGPHAVVVADVTDRAASQAACAEAASVLGAIDILVNNAGTADSAPFMRSDPALFQRMIDVHLLAVVHTTQAVLPGMLERGYGHVVNVASIAGLTGAPYFTAYVAAKHAMVGLTRALALEAGPRGVAVNAVCPGFVDTDLVTDAARRIAAKTGRTEVEAVQSILDNAGQPRIVTADEVAAAVIALCTAPAGAVSGQSVVLDGTQPV